MATSSTSRIDRLRQAVAEEAQRRLLPAVIDAAKLAHRRGWRDCDCRWCALKREATTMVGNMGHIPRYRGGEPVREKARDYERRKYRAKLREAYDD